MILPGLISLAFYRRRPSTVQIALGLTATILLSALLGYISPAGSLGRDGSVLVAIIGGVLLYAAILAYLLYHFRAKRVEGAPSAAPGVPPEV
jgi:hypothetical protein